MCDNQERKSRDFSHYDTMKTQQLQEILRLDSQAQDTGERDTEELLYIMAALAERNKDNADENAALKSWESFQRDFLDAEEDSEWEHTNVAPKSAKKPLKILRWAAVAAAAALAFLGLASVAILSVEAWRVPVLNFMIDRGGEFALVNVGYRNPALKKQYEAIVETVCDNAPSDYTLTETPVVDEPALLIRMKNSEGKLLYVLVGQDTAQNKVDTEDAEIVEMDLNGKPAYLIIKEGLFIIWHDSSRELIYSVSARDVPSNEFWRLVHALAE